MVFENSSNHIVSHYHMLIICMGHVLNKISAYSELLQLVFLYDNLNGPTIPWSVMSIVRSIKPGNFSNVLVSHIFVTYIYFTFWCILDETKPQLILYSQMLQLRKCMLCVQLVHQVYCFST